MRITRLVKSESGDASFETIDDEAEVDQARRPARPARRRRAVRRRPGPRRGARHRDPAGHRRRPRRPARRRASRWCMRYKTTTLGTQLPDRWGLPDALRDDTGVIFASAFPGLRARFVEAVEDYTDRGRREQLLALEARAAHGCATTTPPAPRWSGASPSCGTCREVEPLHLRPAVPVPVPVDGPLAVRRDHRRPRPQHPGQRGLRQHHPGGVAGRGLDPCRPLPPGRRGLGRRRDRRTGCCPGSAPASWPPARPPPTTRSRTRRPRSTAAGTA